MHHWTTHDTNTNMQVKVLRARCERFVYAGAERSAFSACVCERYVMIPRRHSYFVHRNKQEQYHSYGGKVLFMRTHRNNTWYLNRLSNSCGIGGTNQLIEQILQTKQLVVVGVGVSECIKINSEHLLKRIVLIGRRGIVDVKINEGGWYTDSGGSVTKAVALEDGRCVIFLSVQRSGVVRRGNSTESGRR